MTNVVELEVEEQKKEKEDSAKIRI